MPRSLECRLVHLSPQMFLRGRSVGFFQKTNGFATLQETLRNHRFLQQESNPKRDRDCGWGACGEKRENGMSMGATIGPFMMSIFLLVF